LAKIEQYPAGAIHGRTQEHREHGSTQKSRLDLLEQTVGPLSPVEIIATSSNALRTISLPQAGAHARLTKQTNIHFVTRSTCITIPRLRQAMHYAQCSFHHGSLQPHLKNTRYLFDYKPLAPLEPAEPEPAARYIF